MTADEAELGIEPVSARTAGLGGDDLDSLTVVQHVAKRNHLPIDAGATTAMPQLRMHVIGEIDRRRAHRQIDDAPLRRQDIDTVLEHPRTKEFSKVRDIREPLLPVEDLPQPGDLGVVLSGTGNTRAAFL